MSIEDFVAQAFKCGHDTLSISEILHTTEWDVYNALARRKMGGKNERQAGMDHGCSAGR